MIDFVNGMFVGLFVGFMIGFVFVIWGSK